MPRAVWSVVPASNEHALRKSQLSQSCAELKKWACAAMRTHFFATAMSASV